MVKQLHTNQSLLIVLDLCRLHYQVLLIIYLKFTTKNAEIKIANLSVILLGLKIINYIMNATSVKKKKIRTNKWVN